MKLRVFQGDEEVTCLTNHAKCAASCCTTLFMHQNEFTQWDGQNDLTLQINVKMDMIRYFEMHGYTVGHGFVRIPKEILRTAIPVDGWVQLTARCSALTDDLKCSLHGTSKKPRICRDGPGIPGTRTTKHCIYDPKFREEMGMRVEE